MAYRASMEMRELAKEFASFFTNTGGNDVIELAERDTDISTNLPLVLLQVAVIDQLTMLRRLRANNLLLISPDLLWEAQLRFYPGSVRLEEGDAYRWATAPLDSLQRERRLRALCMGLQHPSRVWYHIPSHDQGGLTGCRFGIHGAEYVSNYSCL